MRTGWRTIRIGFLCFTLIGLVFSAQFYFYLHSFGRPVTWTQTLKWNLGSWYLWAALCPAIFSVCRRARLSRPGWLRAVVVHSASGLVLACLHVLAYATWTWLAAPLGVGSPGWAGAVQYLFTTSFSYDLFCYAAIATAFYAIDNARRYREGQIRASRLETQLAQAQLEALRMQLNPHFLFNTLNTIAALIREDPGAAEEMVTRLGELLRAALDTSAVERVPLRDELGFARKYLEIQRVRFGDRLEVSVDAPSETLDVSVPTFILQPLIENAVRYGLRSAEGRCEVRVRVNVADGNLKIEVHDTGPGLGGGHEPLREGIGISNTRARLHQAYGDRADFAIHNGSPDGCDVSLTIPIAAEDGDKARVEDA